VENSVEKHDSIFVSDSAGDGSAFCTGAGAGTLARQRQNGATPARRAGYFKFFFPTQT
jgi:hypothetical protein